MSDISAGQAEVIEVTSKDSALMPIAIDERIDAMDIIRGIALVGILLMNIEWFNRALSTLGSQDTSLTGIDHAVGWLIRCFVEGKFYKLFALLFGMGFAVMLLRAKAAQRPFTAWFTRRMLVLITFGLLHMVFLWGGDILHDYGVAGLLLLACFALLQRPHFQKYDNPRSLAKLVMVWLSIPVLLTVLVGIFFGVRDDNEDLTRQWQNQIQISQHVDAIRLSNSALAEQKAAAIIEATETELLVAEPTLEEFKVHENGANPMSPSLLVAEEVITNNTEVSSESDSLSINDNLVLRAQTIVDEQGVLQASINEESYAFTQDSYWFATAFRLDFTLFMLMFTLPLSFFILLPIFILGYWLVASGIMNNYHQHARVFKVVSITGIGFGLVLETSGLLIAQHPASHQVLLLLGVGESLFFIGQYVMAAGYFGLIMHLLTQGKWQKRLAPFTSLGRMALTNYILQSVILSTLFYGYAGGYFGEISRAPQMLIVLAIIVFQLLFSRWWLSHFAFGPLEWIWRSLSYKRLPTMRL